MPPRAHERRQPLGHTVHGRVIARHSTKPLTRNLVEDRAPDSESLDYFERRRSDERADKLALRRRQTQQYDAPAVGITSRDCALDVLPGRRARARLEFPPVRAHPDLVDS